LCLWQGVNFLKQKLGHLITFRCHVGGGREGGTFNVSGNEKCTVISAARMMQLCKQKLYNYINQNDDDDKK